jgi:hypothetical protein
VLPPNAAALEVLRFRVRCASALAVAGLIGLRLGIALYSGPSIAIGVLTSLGAAVAVWLSFTYLPESAGTVVAYLVGLLL